MLGAAPRCAGRQLKHQWDADLAARHISQFGTLLYDLIICGENEISILEVDDWAHALYGGANRQPNKASF